jgi:hypothetical protein
VDKTLQSLRRAAKTMHSEPHHLRSRSVERQKAHHGVPLVNEFLVGEALHSMGARSRRAASAPRHTGTSPRDDSAGPRDQLESSPPTKGRRLAARGAVFLLAVTLPLLALSVGINLMLWSALRTAGSLSKGWTVIAPMVAAAVPGWLHGAASTALAGTWIVQREASVPWKAALWLLAHLGLGSTATGVYIMRALWDMGPTWSSFWSGKGK